MEILGIVGNIVGVGVGIVIILLFTAAFFELTNWDKNNSD